MPIESAERPETASERAWHIWQDRFLTKEEVRQLEQVDPSNLQAVKPESIIEDEATIAYQKFCSQFLTQNERNILDSLAQPQDTPAECDVKPDTVRYCLVECPDGEWPVVRGFRTPEALARRIGEVEGKDMVLWAFYGVPLQITCGPQRYLVLPDSETALQVPLYSGGPCARVELTLLGELELQKDGFVGHRALIDPSVAQKERQEMAELPDDPDDDDDDDDDDEELEERSSRR
jgi:hypothetical protein